MLARMNGGRIYGRNVRQINMIILGQDRDLAINSDCVVSFELRLTSYEEKFYHVIASRDDAQEYDLGAYTGWKAAQETFCEMVRAWAHGDPYYSMPQEPDEL